ncbi:nitrite reductase small subunit NirD [Naumannella cuiyingiana]|uniref:Nitrite reductase (NADH) small subunit n=1 Tax=Naumannella cuiyingiana TaxID=1347891 RepID=A0A7Z0IKJ2_9ACTN|nr:nitrite reductase small subunit NirD [Naumannella cuiyingiana]NYI70578.1 nitrite reductase (NADH) small subunit [Naumannella cuiyingiana]
MTTTELHHRHTSALPAWTTVCTVARLPVERGVAALVAGRQVAIFRLHDDRVFAVGHRDPFTGVNVIARGIVGSARIGDELVPTVASPLHKQVFDLRTGECLSEPGVELGRWDVRVREEWVQVRPAVAIPRAEVA